ncbi:hypothetical protein P7K49_014575 [Saguinus oedipus]|uniref:Uncharacterized protein n=1 Tax=Saguinus oedipus TaxID=9490 RepID=A0ABQ9V742_SAGOE|nr:hypothetical protein P7K49_014575 [Saguinus oedipus]
MARLLGERSSWVPSVPHSPNPALPSPLTFKLLWAPNLRATRGRSLRGGPGSPTPSARLLRASRPCPKYCSSGHYHRSWRCRSSLKSARKLQRPSSSLRFREGLSRGYSILPCSATAQPHNNGPGAA